VPADRESPAAGNAGAAEKLFAGSLTRDFGDVAHGTRLLHRFAMANVYSAPVTIAYLQPSCDCVTATAAKSTLQPGERATIDVRLEAGHFAGPDMQNVRVKVTGPGFESTCKLVVSAVIQPDDILGPCASAVERSPPAAGAGD
jgi:hypothetical protein